MLLQEVQMLKIGEFPPCLVVAGADMEGGVHYSALTVLSTRLDSLSSAGMSLDRRMERYLV